jgi:hypothetical protein
MITSLRSRPLNEITEEDVRALVGTSEDPYLDFKARLYKATDADKHELAKDVTAIANAYGGDLVIGVEDDDGFAKAIVPVPHAGEAVEWLQQVCASLVEERISGLDARSVPVSGGHLIIVRIPQSLRGPHRVRRGDQTYFYRRFGQHNLPMSLPDIREAFMRSTAWQESAEKFFAERASEARPHEHFVVGLLPVPISQQLVTPTDADLLPILQEPPYTRPMGWRARAGQEIRFTLHGLQSDTGRHRLELWRNGNLEIAIRAVGSESSDWNHLGITLYGWSDGSGSAYVLHNLIPIVEYTVTAARLAAVVYRHVGYDGPVAGWLYFNMFRMPYAPHADLIHDMMWKTVGRDSLRRPEPFPIYVPPVVVDTPRTPDRLARQLLEPFWNAFDRPAVPHFSGDQCTIPGLPPFPEGGKVGEA